MEAVLVGLVGVDMVHCFATELHPVYGFAVQVIDHPVQEERWALFARLVGGEGECGEGSFAPALKIAPRGRLVLPLPWRRDKSGKLLPPPFIGEGTALFATEGSDLKGEDEVRVQANPRTGWIEVSIPVAPLAGGDESARAWTRVSGELVLRYASAGLESVESTRPARQARLARAMDSASYFKEIASRKDREERLVASLKKLDEKEREKVLEALYQTVARANAGPDDETPLKVRRVVAPPSAAESLEVREVPPAASAPKKIPNPWYVDPE